METTPPSYWPAIGSVGLFSIAIGLANWLHGSVIGFYIFSVGVLTILFTIFGWFRQVVNEGLVTKDETVELSFRWGMAWFIFTEVMFFLTFFGVLFFIRVYTVPWLAGVGEGKLTHYLLWPHFEGIWPLLKTPDASAFLGPKMSMSAWGLPAINTLVLLTSGITITIAHWGIAQGKKRQAIIGQVLTICLGLLFLFLQAEEYGQAYSEFGLRLDAGIYGATFFMLTGFHGLHVTLGTIMLIVILFRIIKNHFSADSHFAFEAVAWYWHFVDVVWLALFVFVYWL